MSIGTTFMINGALDMFNAVKSVYYGEAISWKGWFFKKAISYSITFLCAGTEVLNELMDLAGEGI